MWKNPRHTVCMKTLVIHELLLCRMRRHSRGGHSQQPNLRRHALLRTFRHPVLSTPLMLRCFRPSPSSLPLAFAGPSLQSRSRRTRTRSAGAGLFGRLRVGMLHTACTHSGEPGTPGCVGEKGLYCQGRRPSRARGPLQNVGSRS